MAMAQLNTVPIPQPEVIADQEPGRRLGFITATPQSVHRGSGCYVGIGTLAAGATALGNHVEMIVPNIRLGSYLAERYLFNQTLRLRRE